MNVLSITFTRPPRTNTAPPPPPSRRSPVLLPCVKVRPWIVSCGWSWFWQCEVVQIWAWSHVFMYRMRRWPAPLSVTLPPPSSTTTADVLTTFAVSVITIVTGSGAAVERDDPAARDRVDDRLRRAARRRAGADHPIGMRRVDRPCLVGQRDSAGIAGAGRGQAARDRVGGRRTTDPCQDDRRIDDRNGAWTGDEHRDHGHQHDPGGHAKSHAASIAPLLDLR